MVLIVADLLGYQLIITDTKKLENNKLKTKTYTLTKVSKHSQLTSTTRRDTCSKHDEESSIR